MIRGSIATPNIDPKTWRGKGRKPKQSAVASAIVTATAPKKRQRGPVTRLDADVRSDEATTQRRSAIVEPKSRRASVFGDVPDITDEERNRRADMADAMFREIKRRAALPE
jgi:hypothetical protein